MEKASRAPSSEEAHVQEALVHSQLQHVLVLQFKLLYSTSCTSTHFMLLDDLSIHIYYIVCQLLAIYIYIIAKTITRKIRYNKISY